MRTIPRGPFAKVDAVSELLLLRDAPRGARGAPRPPRPAAPSGAAMAGPSGGAVPNLVSPDRAIPPRFSRDSAATPRDVSRETPVSLRLAKPGAAKIAFRMR
ncbi:MAG: hypothetical protein ACK56F_08260, partial [bacterium]